MHDVNPSTRDGKYFLVLPSERPTDAAGKKAVTIYSAVSGEKYALCCAPQAPIVKISANKSRSWEFPLFPAYFAQDGFQHSLTKCDDPERGSSTLRHETKFRKSSSCASIACADSFHAHNDTP